MGVKINYEVTVELDLEQVILALSGDLLEYGEVPRDREQALERLSDHLQYHGLDLGEIEDVKADWDFIAEMNEAPSFKAFEAMCLEWFPELREG